MTETLSFDKLGLSPQLLSTLSALGFEEPTPIQAASIPVVLSGQDCVALAQTGTGKTAAYGLPILSQIDLDRYIPQALILAPTRELAMQVTEALRQYGKNLPNLSILPVYGGKNYTTQLKELKRGVHIVVGTPGRIQDHITRRTLDLSGLRTVVLDEADEMLNMGFEEDVKAILEEIPVEHQTVLFSATMPPKIRDIAEAYLKQPQKIQIKSKTATVASTQQLCFVISHEFKFEAMTRYLETEDYDGVLIFTRTKIATQELADKLERAGYLVSAMNGDMKQDVRESVIKRIKNGKLDIIVATEVAARGLDVTRISHVINYELPEDVASYIHRIGRTGRAGRVGKALLLASPRERRKLQMIEQTTKQPLSIIDPPTTKQVQQYRSNTLQNTLQSALNDEDSENYQDIVRRLTSENNISATQVAAAAIALFAKNAFSTELSTHDNFVNKSDFDRSRDDKKPKRFSGKNISKYSGDSRKSEGSRKSFEGRKSGESRKFGDSRKSGETRKFGEARKSAEAHKSSDSRKSAETNKFGDSRKSNEPHKSSDSRKSSETNKFGDSRRSNDSHKSSDSRRSSETRKFGDSHKSNESHKSSDSRKPSEKRKFGDSRKSTETHKSADSRKSNETRKFGDSRKSTETGKSFDARKFGDPLKLSDVRKSADSRKSQKPYDQKNPSSPKSKRKKVHENNPRAHSFKDK